MIAGPVTQTAGASDAVATYRLGPGWATFGIALPPTAAANAVQVGTLPTQTDVKVRWPDGSIRFGVVSVRVASGGTYAIASASRMQGEFAPTLPPASVTFTIGGKPYVASLPSVLTDSWLAGPLVSERRAVVAPGGHPFLRVIFDVRSYTGGGHRVDVAVENCLDVAGADSVTYDVVVTVGDVRVYSQTGVKHKYLARWRKVFTTGGLKEASVAPDMAPFVAARALPPFLPTVAAPNRSTTGNGVSGTGFGILGFGDLTVLINPAFEATRFEPLAQAAVARRYVVADQSSKQRAQLPLLIVATSRTDEATGTAFPLFRRVSTPFERASGAERSANIRTIGWESRYKTHEIKVDPASNPCNTTNTMNFTQRLAVEAQWSESQRNAQYASFNNATLALCDSLVLSSEHHTWSVGNGDQRPPAYMPLWIVQADKSVIDGHNDFLNDHFVDFIRQVYYTILRDGDDRMDEMRERGRQRVHPAP